MSDDIKIPEEILELHKGKLFDVVSPHGRTVWSGPALAQAVARWMREECAKVAQEKVSFSPLPNPSDMDRGWKRCAATISSEIRLIGSNHLTEEK